MELELPIYHYGDDTIKLAELDVEVSLDQLDVKELTQNDKGYWNIKLPKTGGGFGGAKWEDMKKAYDARFDSATARSLSLDETRRWAFSWYFRRDGRAPHISNYKRNAVSLYLRIQEQINENSFQEAVGHAVNLWY